jgi:uncharacterized PurR-regulated membrane protein YhhQ (DUF165 family)
MHETLKIVIFLVAPAIYLAPAIEAKARNREDAPTIFLINLILGWTVIGWFAAFMLARRNRSARRLSNVAKRNRRRAARSTIARIVSHAHDCPIFGRRTTKARCVILAS